MASKAVKQSSGSSGLASFFKVKAGESRAVFLIGFAIMATEAGYWLGGNGVDALVFNRLDLFKTLPFLLIGKGVLAFFAISLYNVWLVRVNKAVLLTATSLLTMLVLVLARIILQINHEPPAAFFFVLFPVTYIIPDMLLLQAWFLAREVFDSRQSKRLFPLITALGIVGMVGGNFLTGPLTKVLQAEGAISAWAVLVFLAFLAMFTLRREIDKKKPPVKRRKGERPPREDAGGMVSRLKLGYTFIRYYRIIWLLAFAAGITMTLYWISFLFFLQAAISKFPKDAEGLAGFLGLINGTAMLVASLISFFLANRLFARVGIRNILLALPITDFLSFALLLFTNIRLDLAADLRTNLVVGTRYGQMIVKEGLNNSASKTLYNLMPSETREVAETFNNAVSQQLGIVVAGLLMLLLVPFGPVPLLWIGLALSVAYLIISWRMRYRYRGTLVQLLKEGQQDFFRNDENTTGFTAEVGVGNAGDDPLAIAVNGLNDTSEGTRRLSAELLGRIGSQDGVKPLIKALLTDPSAEVRRTAIVSLKELDINRALPNIAEAMTDWDPGVRAEAAAAMRDLKSDNGRPPDASAFYYLRKGLEDSSPTVKREAAITMSVFGRKGEALWVLWEMGRSSDAAVRREAATAYGMLGDKVLVRELVEMLDDADPLVRRQAAGSLGNLSGRPAINALLNAFDDDNPGVRDEAANSLALLRMQSGRTLLQYLFSTSSSKGQAAALQALSLAKSYEMQEGNAQRWADRRQRLLNSSAADAGAGASVSLNKQMILNPLRDGVGFDLTQADEARLLSFGRMQIALARRLLTYLQEMRGLDLSLAPVVSNPALQLAWRARRNPENLLLLNRSIKERYDAAILRAVNIVGMLGNIEAINLVASGLQDTGRNAARMRADAIETLENLGDPRLTPDLIALLETREDEPAQLNGKELPDILIEIWLEGDEWLRACVLHVIGMFDLRRLRPLVDQVFEADPNETEHDPWVEEAAMEATQRLEWPRDDFELNRMLEKSLTEKDMQTLGTLSTMSRILFLQKVPIFANLSPEDLRRVALVSLERLYSPNEIICYEGDPGDELYIVVSGRVQVLVGYGENEAKTLAVRGEGEAVGEMAILDDIPRAATLRAYGGPVRLLTLSADEFKRILRERPELAVEVIRVLSRQLRDTNKRLQATSGLDNVAQQNQPQFPVAVQPGGRRIG